MGKPKPNGFLMFMLQWKKEQERKGRKFPNGLKDVQTDPVCNAEWQGLSANEKAMYKEQSKNGPSQPLKKRTGTGQFIDDLMEMRAREREFLDNMVDYVENLIKVAQRTNTIQNIKFYLIHVNYFYYRVLDNNDIDYYPAEIAIAEFSLEDGPKRIYDTIVNEKIQIGFASTAKEQSNLYHQIPVEGSIGKSDYIVIFKEICEFLEPGKKNGKFPPLFTLHTIEDIYRSTKSVLGRLAIAANNSEDFFKLYSFEELFSKMHNAIIEESLVKFEPIVAKIELQKDPFAYYSGLGCQFHENMKIGMNFCSRSIIQRWFFVLCNHCCEPLGISILEGIHKPKGFVSSCVGSLDQSFSNISLNDSRTYCTASISDLSIDHKRLISERKSRDEQRRRAESKSLKIIDSMHIVNKPSEPIERPLRPPHTKSAVAYIDTGTTDTESIDFSESSFPSIGRGAIKKKIQLKTSKVSAGHGFAN